MEIETGKTYLTRGGEKVTILTTELNNTLFKVAGIIEEDGQESVDNWLADGSWALKPDIPNFTGFSRDLVAEYVVKPEFDRSLLPLWCNKAIAMDCDGRWFAYEKVPINLSTYQNWDTESGQLIHIPEEYAPKWDGKPEDSLIVWEDEDDTR